MSLAIDVLLILICILIIGVSTKRGFFRTLMALVSKVVAIICAFTFTPRLAELIKTRYLLDPVANSIADTLKSLAHVENGKYDIAKLFSDMPQTLSSILSRYNVDQTTVNSMVSDAQGKGEEAITAISKTISGPIVDIISKTLAFIGIYLLVVLALALLTTAINAFFELPVLSQANTLGGFALGVVMAAIVMIIYAAVATRLLPALSSISPQMFGEDVLEKTILVRYISELDVVGLIKKFFG